MTTGVEIPVLMQHSSRPSLFPRLFACGFLLLGLAAVPARAELVILVDGSVMKVAGFQADGDQARIVFAAGGTMTMPIERIDRVLDDEYTPPPEPEPTKTAAQAEAEALKLAAIPLHFEEAQAKVPDGPYGPMIFEAAKRHALNPQVVAALIRTESAGNPRHASARIFAWP